MDFGKVKKDIESLESNRDSDFFHSLARNLLKYLKFKFKEQWYEIDVVGEQKPIQFTNIEYIKLLGDVPQVKNFSRRERFERKKEFVVVTTNHATLESFLSNHYVARSIMSNSRLGLDNKVLTADGVKASFHSTFRDPLAIAFDRNYVVRLGNLYFIHPRFLYELCLKNK
ncbi:MAG: hypothetical protein QXR60_01910 [Candidatus Nanoarchaeia archaeon]